MSADDHQGHESSRRSIAFTADMLVLGDVTDMDSVPPAHISRFADDTWYLYPAARKPTVRTLVNFTECPTRFPRSTEADRVVHAEPPGRHGHPRSSQGSDAPKAQPGKHRDILHERLEAVRPRARPARGHPPLRC